MFDTINKGKTALSFKASVLNRTRTDCGVVLIIRSMTELIPTTQQARTCVPVNWVVKGVTFTSRTNNYKTSVNSVKGSCFKDTAFVAVSGLSFLKHTRAGRITDIISGRTLLFVLSHRDY